MMLELRDGAGLTTDERESATTGEATEGREATEGGASDDLCVFSVASITNLSGAPKGY